MTTAAIKKEKRQAIHRRIRAKVSGTADCPRLAFFKSHINVYAQIIDDTKGKTLVAVSSLKSTQKGLRSRAVGIGRTVGYACQREVNYPCGI